MLEAEAGGNRSGSLTGRPGTRYLAAILASVTLAQCWLIAACHADASPDCCWLP